jgi:hypothetical protein
MCFVGFDALSLISSGLSKESKRERYSDFVIVGTPIKLKHQSKQGLGLKSIGQAR